MTKEKTLGVVSLALLFGAATTLADGNPTLDGGLAFITSANNIPVESANHSNHNVPRHGGVIYADTEIWLTGTRTFQTNQAGANGGAIYADDDLFISGTQAFTNNTAGRNGGAIYADDNVIFYGNLTFNGNTANGYGGAIYADDNITFYGVGTTAVFENNKANGSPNDIFLADPYGRLTFLDAASYDFYSGIDTSRGGALIIRDEAHVGFQAGSVNKFGGLVRVQNAILWTHASSTSTFSGGLEIHGGATSVQLEGTITLGGTINFVYDSASDSFGTINLSNADSVTLLPGTRVVLSGNLSVKGLEGKALEIIAGSASIDLNSLSGQTVANAVLYRTETQVVTNHLVLTTTRKTTEEAVAAVGGNAEAAVALYDADTVLDTVDYERARKNSAAATGELVASDAYARLRRTFVALDRAEQFLAYEIAGTAQKKSAVGSIAVSRNERLQASNGEIPGGSQGVPVTAKEWEFSIAYSGMSGDVDSVNGFDSYDYSGNAIWLGLKKTFNIGTFGALVESGNTTTQSSSSKIEAQELGLTAFFFAPITDSGTYTFAQARFSKGNNDFSRSFSGTTQKGEFSSWNYAVQAEIGTNFGLTEWLNLNPYFSAAYAFTDSDPFSDGQNSYSAGDAYDIEVSPGMRLRADFSVAEMPTYVSVGLAWSYLCIDDRLDTEVSRGNTTATVLGNRGEQSFIEAEIDAGIELTDNIAVGAGYGYAGGSDASEHRLYLRGSYRF